MAPSIASFKESEGVPGHRDPRALREIDLELSREHVPRLWCAACRAFVTDSAARLERSGAHAHTFVNPSGVVYHVGCFARAPGTSGIGGESEEFSWFSGFAWQIVLCRGCGAHLGWRFRARDESPGDPSAGDVSSAPARTHSLENRARSVAPREHGNVAASELMR